jgi:aspartate aminotransferase
MDHISQRVENLAVSATLAMMQKGNELRAQGVDVIGLSAGEPDFNTPEFVKEAAKAAIDNNFSHYTAVAGYESLRKSVCAKLKRENGLDYTPNCIVVGNGAKQELANALLATINPGDEVIIPVPAWVSYVELVKLAEGTPVLVPATAENDFKITPEQLKAAITPKSKMIMLNSPCNPTGSVYSKEELAALAEVLLPYPEILIISDEIYEHINFVGGCS